MQSLLADVGENVAKEEEALSNVEDERVKEAGAELMRICLRHGGTLSGEHGIGVEKRELMPEAFSEVDLAVMQRLKRALDPDCLSNPGKIFPTPGQCAELRPHPRGGIGW